MTSDTLQNQLQVHQDAILAIIGETEPLLRDSDHRDVATLARTRWTLMRLLTAYAIFKHGQIFDPIISRKLTGQVSRAERLKRACMAVGDEFRGHVTKWSGQDVKAEWAQYQPAALAIIARLRSHLTIERQEIAGLLVALRSPAA